ncbi:V-ATPase V1 sector subunit E [Thecaphora frezii]
MRPQRRRRCARGPSTIAPLSFLASSLAPPPLSPPRPALHLVSIQLPPNPFSAAAAHRHPNASPLLHSRRLPSLANMSSRPMNDDEVLSEMKKMVAFIKQEAMEKAREIQIKADEEFAIEKAKIVRQEAINIESQYEKKKKQAETAQKIAQSNQSNKSRLKILQTREQHLQTLFDQAKERLSGLTEDQQTYKQLLQKLILQGLLQLMEKKVVVTVRSTDVQLAQEAAKGAEADYKEASGRGTSVEVKEGLDGDSFGGVILAGSGGKIVINNTLEERLRLLEDKLLPEIRLDLFGPNQNRKFFN